MTSEIKGLVNRHVLQILKTRASDEPVIALLGPRSVGKSTLLAEFAKSNGVGVIDLDDLAVRDMALVDPGGMVSGKSPICIDEYQHAPIVLDAIKAELNRDLRPGRFILSGSTRYEALPLAAQSLTGRLHLMQVLPLSQVELEKTDHNFVQLLLERPADILKKSPTHTSRQEYVERVVAGGFPLALMRTSVAARNRWFDDYLDRIVERDVLELSKIRQRSQVPRLLQRLAGQTAQVLNVRSAAKAIDMEESTAETYTRLLESVFLLQRLPAWGRTLLSRSVASPKIHMVDSGLAARLMRVNSSKLVALDPAAQTQFGQLLETFVFAEIAKQASWLDGIAELGHWRTHDGDEVDIVIERDDGTVVAIEVKAGSRFPADQTKGMRKLRDMLGKRFLAGIALCAGSRTYTLEDRIYVVPVDALWNIR